MSRVFAYCRVSTQEQTVENQIVAIKNAGYDVPINRIISEVISGKTPAMQRKGFKALIEHSLEDLLP